MSSWPCLAIAFAFGCASSRHQEVPAAHDPARFSSALETANRSRHPLVVELGAAWCKPCHVFAAHVLTDPRVQAALHVVTFVQYDIDTPAGADAMHHCNVTGVPAIVSLDSAGNVRRGVVGTAPTVDEFLIFLRDTAADR